MHRALGFLSKRFVQVRPGEGRKVVLTFLYFFFIITAYYLIKPVSRSLVLGELGSRMVPRVDLLCAFLMGPIVTLFARLVDRVKKPVLVSHSFLSVICVLLGFWKLISLRAAWVAGAFYIWVSIFSVLVVTLFWLVANDLYRPREAKRLFGLIGSGGILGGIAGSSIAAVGAQIIGTEHLLLLSAGLMLACWVVVQQLWTLAPDRAMEGDERRLAPRRDTFLSNAGDFFRLIFQSRYLVLLIVVVAVGKMITTLIYYQLNPFIEQTFLDQDARTTFNGMFFGGINIVAFIVQFFFTSWVLRRWGLFVSLVALPIGLLVGTTGLLIFPMFWVAAATELYDGSMNYSLQQTTKEVLYLPIDRSIRYKVKPFIDMVVFRFGKGIAAVLGIVLLDGLHIPARYLSCVAIPLLVAWLVAAIQLRRDYVMRIRTILQAHVAGKRASSAPPLHSDVDTGAGEPAEAELYGSLTDGRCTVEKLTLIDQLMSLKEPVSSHARELVAELTAYETHIEQTLEFEMEAQRLKRIINHQGQSMATRCQAIRLLARAGDQDTVDYLFGIAMVEVDASLRQEAVRGLVKLRLRGTALEFPIQPIRRQIGREVVNYRRIIHVAEVYRQHHRGPFVANNPLIGLLRILMEESVEQIFRLLMLMYRPEDIHLVYEQLRVADAYLRADAIELLDNLVDPAMRVMIFPILDEDQFLSLVEEGTGTVHDPAAAYRLLQGAIWDHNCWLSVTALCAIGQLRLTAMRPELEKALRHTVPLVSKAAKVALHLATLT